MAEATFDIAKAFQNKSIAMQASFLAIREVTKHPTIRGDQSEADWVGLIGDFLPKRYAVGPIFAVDHYGHMSEQIDAAVYDTHYSPQWFGTSGSTRFVPVESVYAVFEVKPQFSSDYLREAQKKVASVRNLERTSSAVVHKGGEYSKEEIRLFPIIGGILTTRKALEDPVSKLNEIQPTQGDSGFLNIGICLDQFAFDYTPSVIGDEVVTKLQTKSDGNQLIHFCVRLFRQLQAVGTVPAADMTRYEERI